MPARPARHPFAAGPPGSRLPTPARPIPARTIGADVDPDRAVRCPEAPPPTAPRPRATSAADDVATPSTGVRPAAVTAAEEGSVATEYGLLAVVAATIVSVMLQWATGGGIASLLNSVMARVSSLVGL